MCMNEPRRNGGDRASGRANSRTAAAIAVDVASSSTVPGTTYNKEKLFYKKLKNVSCEYDSLNG